MSSTLRKMVRPALPVLGATAAFSFCINALMLTLPLYMMQGFDRVLPARSGDTLLMLTLLAVFLLLVMAALDVVRSRVMVRLSVWLQQALAEDLLTAAAAAATRRQTEEAGAGVLRDLQTVRQYVAGSAMLALFDAPWVPLFLAVIVLIHPLLGAVATGGALVLLALTIATERLTAPPLAEATQASRLALTEAGAVTANAQVIRAMGMVDGLLGRWRTHDEAALRRHALASDRAGAVSAATRACRMAIQVALLGGGLWLALDDALTGGAMVAASIIMGRALAPVEQVIGGWRQTEEARAALSRISEVLAAKPPPHGEIRFDVMSGPLTVEGVSFLLPGAPRPVLNGLSFTVHPGEVLAVVGPTASGKSTLARLLTGVWPAAQGTVRLSGAAVHGWHPDNAARWVGYLPQDVGLLSGSVREIVARHGAIDDARVLAAVRAAGAHDMIARLPQGYDTLLGPGGEGLSGGQRQRLALARALYGEPHLLVLDEPNANLDQEGEAALTRAVTEATARGAVVVVVSHRRSILAAATRVLVLRDGRLHLFGPRDKVLERLAAPKEKETAA